jgi:hypothetical protein
VWYKNARVQLQSGVDLDEASRARVGTEERRF